MDEAFDLGRRGRADRPDLVQRQVPFEDHPREARLAQKTGPLGRRVAHLRRGVQFDGQRHPPQGHVLHDQRIDARGDQLPGLPFGLLQLVVPHQRVERGMDPYAIAAGVLHDAGDLLRGVARGLPGPELRTADIDGVGAVIHGGHGRGVIFGGSQEFDGFHECGILHKNKTISGIVL